MPRYAAPERMRLARRERAPAPNAPLPTPSREIHCAAPNECFDAAKALCRGPWHQVAEPGMAFPAIVNDEQGAYRMLVACDE